MTIESKEHNDRNSLEKNLLKLENFFLQDLQHNGRSKNTIKNYKTDLECFNNFLRESQKSLKIDKFDISHTMEYGAYLQKRYNSDNSKRRRVQALRIFFDFLVKHHHFPSNPIRSIPTSPKFLDIPRPTPLIDIKTLWSHLLEESKSKNNIIRLLAQRNQIILLLIYGSALKVSDLSQLKVNHLIINANPRVLIDHNKKDPYTIPLPTIFTDVCKQYLIHLEEMKKVAKIDFTEILFNANPYRILSGGLSARGLETIFEDFRKKLMITLTPKSLRQACIFKWIQQNKKNSQIKEWLGVSPSYVLKTYKEHSIQYIYNDVFLAELYYHYHKKEY